MIEIGACVACQDIPAEEPKRRTPPAMQNGHAVDPAVRAALFSLLQSRHVGRENAATWEALLQELVALGMKPVPIRRLQEAGVDLLEKEGRPIVGLSEAGVFWARTAEEVEQALRQNRKRALNSLRRHRMHKRAWLSLRGQEPMPPPVGGEEVT